MWRDPMDELIEDLERVLPEEPRDVLGDESPVVVIQEAAQLITSGRGDEVNSDRLRRVYRRLFNDPNWDWPGLFSRFLRSSAQEAARTPAGLRPPRRTHSPN